MTDKETIDLKLIKPSFSIGQKIYIPGKERVTKTKIIGYQIGATEEDKTLVGVCTSYFIDGPLGVEVRRGEISEFVHCVLESDFYIDKKEANAASRFLNVACDDETWKLAVGDRKITDESSPYYINNCDLPHCCANTDEARAILGYCKANGGLIVYHKDQIVELLSPCFDLPKLSVTLSLGKILKQLEVYDKQSSNY